ncbi:MAG: hypothetical protein HOY79_39575, partial [Streptomyces sp.]|nr:hypothetical protein [Streptomyces sp.]
WWPGGVTEEATPTVWWPGGVTEEATPTVWWPGLVTNHPGSTDGTAPTASV